LADKIGLSDLLLSDSWGGIDEYGHLFCRIPYKKSSDFSAAIDQSQRLEDENLNIEIKCRFCLNLFTKSKEIAVIDQLPSGLFDNVRCLLLTFILNLKLRYYLGDA
jgi:hypothetical protein